MADPETMNPDDPGELRRRAEEVAAERVRQQEPPSPERLQELVHELQVHQIELEMQNDSLRQARTELELSRDRYADLYDFAPTGYATLDEHGILREINLTATALLGKERARLLGHPLVAYVNQGAKNRFVDYLRRCREASEGQEVVGETVLDSPGRGTVPVQLRTVPVRDPHTAQRRYRMALVDLTELRHSEEALRTSEEMLALAVEAAGAGTWQVDCQTGEFTASEPAHAMHGLAPAITRSRDAALAAIHPDDRPAVAAAMQRAIETGEGYHAEYRTVLPDGTVRWFASQARVCPTRHGKQLLGLVRDITDRKQADEALRKSEERLRLALEGGQLGLWDRDLLTNTSTWNRREFELLGLPPQDQPVDGERFFECIHAEDLPRVRRLVTEAVESGTDFRDEFRVVRGDGKVRWLAAMGRVYRDEEGRPLHMVGVNFDITDRKQAEIELRSLNQTLERRVAERTSALAMLRDVAFMANQARDVEEAIRYCLRRVAEHNGWSFGHAYLPAADDPDLLLPTYAWYAKDTQRFRPFRELTLKTPLRRGEGIPGRVYASGKPEWTGDVREHLESRRMALAHELGIATAAAFPVLVGDKVAGVLKFFSDTQIVPDEQMLESMAGVGAQLGRVIERTAFQRELLAVADEEQRRIGRDLHDDVGQELTGLALKAETLAQIVADGEMPARGLVEDVMTSLDRARRTIRELSRTLVAVDVESLGLAGALEELAARTRRSSGVACTADCPDRGLVSDGRTATHLYRVAQEAVNNAVKHGQAADIQIALKREADHVLLSVRDDGVGIPPEDQRGRGVGLRSMQYRAGIVGASYQVQRPAEGGTLVTCRLPRAI